MPSRQLTSLALLPKSPSYLRGHHPRGCLMGVPRRITAMAAPSPVKGSRPKGIGESGPRRFLVLGGWWQQRRERTLTCEHRGGQHPGEEQQRHAQGQTKCHPGPSEHGRRAGCTEH